MFLTDINMLDALSDDLMVAVWGAAAKRTQVSASKYRDWQVLSYEGVLDRQLLQKKKLM